MTLINLEFPSRVVHIQSLEVVAYVSFYFYCIFLAFWSKVLLEYHKFYRRELLYLKKSILYFLSDYSHAAPFKKYLVGFRAFKSSLY